MQGGEGGWHECRWSITLNECISPSYQPLYCAGGVCGLVLSGGNIDRCPQPCASYTQCSTCLRHTHCGWCALNVLNKTGQVNNIYGQKYYLRKYSMLLFSLGNMYRRLHV